MLQVSEIFCSIQGESTYAGLPCVFVRLSGCNLRCRYCDTKYAYPEGINLTVDYIIERIKEFGVSLVEITGGEPLLQKDTNRLVNQLLKQGFRVLIETNGSLDIGRLPTRALKIMDLKCPSSGQTNSILWKNLRYIRPVDQIKFVIANKKDYAWAMNLISRKKLSGKCQILFSPVWKKMKPAQLASWILHDRLQVRLQVQLHKVIWPRHRRGV